MVLFYLRFGFLIYNFFIKIFVCIVKGLVNFNGLYMLFICESIVFLVRFFNRFEMLFLSIGCVVFFFFLGERFILILNWSWFVFGFYVILSIFFVGLGSIVFLFVN